MSILDILPIELLHEIAGDSEPSYKALISAYPRFARKVTPGKRIDYMIAFGYDVKITEDCTMWYQNGKLHRLDGPAVIYSDGQEEWYRNGKLHRDDGPARIYAAGDEEWYQNDVPHRDDGPAVIYVDGYKEWLQNGVLHRLDGPAVICSDGFEEWFHDGQFTWYQNGKRCDES